MRDASPGTLAEQKKSKSLSRAMAAIRQMGRKWLLMVPAMFGIDCSCPPRCPSPQSILTKSAREEDPSCWSRIPRWPPLSSRQNQICCLLLQQRCNCQHLSMWKLLRCKSDSRIGPTPGSLIDTVLSESIHARVYFT